VLAPGGQVVSLDFNRPANSVVRAAYLAYLSVVGATLGWVLHRDPDTYRYIPASIRLYPARRAWPASSRGAASQRCAAIQCSAG
jgi:demethylmenaquinone methyltransferase/2-methoxy-6-polyprenyl-1,4-benzoquinol methylase